jgi:hypothetical protein
MENSGTFWIKKRIKKPNPKPYSKKELNFSTGLSSGNNSSKFLAARILPPNNSANKIKNMNPRKSLIPRD